MFRRLVTSLPEDPKFPHDLKSLGYDINPDGFIKRIDFPDDDFRFHITNNERYNDVHREAMHSCIRHEVLNRLQKLFIWGLHLPTLTSTVPHRTIPSLRIACTPRHILSRKRRLIVLMNRQFEDLAILSYRLLSKTGGIDEGSAVAFVQEIIRRSGGDKEADTTPGVLILNPGQLLYSYRNGYTMTPTSWDAMSRKSAVHPMPLVHADMNRVKGNATVQEHLHFVFSQILCSEKFVAKDAEIYFVGLGDGGDELVKYLEANWQTLTSRLHLCALALTAPLSITPETSHIPLTNKSFLEFMATRAKAWAMSSEPMGDVIADSNALSVSNGDGHEEADGKEHDIIESEEEDVVIGGGKEDNLVEKEKEDDEYVTLDDETNHTIQEHAETLEHPKNSNPSHSSTEPSSTDPSTTSATPTSTAPEPTSPPVKPSTIPATNEPAISGLSHHQSMENRPIHLCPTVSSGEDLFAECVFPRVYGEVLDWFLEMAG